MTSQTAREALIEEVAAAIKKPLPDFPYSTRLNVVSAIIPIIARIEAEALARGRMEGAKAREALLKAATDLRDDMIMRGEMNKHRNDGEVVIEAGNGVWFRFCAAIVKGLNDETA